ncbi:MAG: peroxiredoxin family protein [Hyphomonas sp.]|nr:peroxiredoxin family protein [Hyphomonas sp.]
MIRSSILAAVLAMLPAAGGAQEAPEPASAPAATPAIGLALGQVAPPVQLVRRNGDAAGLADVMGEKGVAIAFVRSADWCPYCQTQLKQIDGISGDLADLGWPLVAVSYDPPDTLSKFADRHELGFELLSDPGSAAISAFNLLNEEMTPGSRYYGIPHPAIMFIGADETVRAILREESYKKRPNLDVILQIAEQL